VAQGIFEGKQPPTLTGLRGDTVKVRAELQRMGYDLATAEQDWHATQRYLSTLNGPQQVRLKQAVDVVYHSVDIIDQLATEWDSMGLPVLSKANLELAKSGAKGQAAQSLAVRLDGQIGDVVSELAVMYKGGGSPTDEGLKLAAKNLQGTWARQTLLDSTQLIRVNAKMRRNSIINVGVAASAGNAYAPNVADTAPNHGGSASGGAGVRRRVFDEATGTFKDQ
jgi:hypothetical protein